MAAAALKATGGKVVLSDSDEAVQTWIRTRGGELISGLSEESRRAVMNIILRGQALAEDPRRLAQEIRPLIGLNQRQAQANVTYRERVYQRFIERGLSPSKAAEKSDAAALRYAGKQHRYRAETIVNTEMAFAYNRGAHMSVCQAIANGYMGRCEMVWSTAGTNRVCSRCMELRGRVVGTTEDSGVTIPPLHPRCRCTIMYQEVAPARALRPNKPQIGSSIKNSDSVLTPEQSKVYQTAEDMAYNARTNADFNFKKMASEPVWAKEIRFANGDGKGVGRRINCQRCVIAHEARMRGYDVIARPSWGKDDPLQKVGNWLKVFEDESREVYNCVGSTIKGIESFISMKMNEWGKGSRAFVWFKWQQYEFIETGHVIVTQLKENGFVQYGDPQRKLIGAVRCLQTAKIDSFVIMRVDNLKFTDLVKRCCANRE